MQPIVRPQLVVQPVEQWVGQRAVSCIQTFYRLINQLTNRLHRVNKHPTGCQTSCTAGLATCWMFVYTMQPVVQTFVQPV